jgi:hypothetical protein
MSRVVAASFTLLAFCSLATAQQAPVEVRFCGPQALHPYPLSSEAGLQGLLLPYVAIVNRGSEPLQLESLDITLQRGSEVLDSRRITRTEIDVFGQMSAQLQAVPAAKDALALFCEQHLVPQELSLGGPLLPSRHALLIVNQAFAFDDRPAGTQR